MIIEIIYVVAISISGFFGKSALENTGGMMIPLGIGFAIVSHSFSWLWVVAWLVGMFIGWGIVVFKDVAKEGSGSSSEPYVYTSEGDAFTISFPNKPEFTQHQGRVRMYRCVGGGLGSLVMVSNPDFTSVKDYNEVLEIERNPEKLKEVQRAELQKSLSILPNTVDTLINVRNQDTFHGLPCADAEYVNSGLYTFTLKFYVGDRAFDITVAHHDKEVAEPEFHRFVESFRFTNS